MAEINPQHLLERADRTNAGPGRPRQVDLRRGVSDAYYAMFHSLTGAIAVQALPNMPPDVAMAYRRTLRHGALRDVCERIAKSKNLPKPAVLSTLATQDADVRLVAQTFVDLQEERHLADYSHDERFDLVRLKDAISLATRAMRTVDNRRQDPSMAAFLARLALVTAWTSG